MLRKYTITSFIALSIATAPLTTPAAMAKDNVDRFLIGLVTIGIAGAIANEVSDNKKQWRVEPHSPKNNSHTKHFHKKKKRHHHRHHHAGSKHVHHHHYKPRTCLRQRWTNHGWIKFYSKRCLRQHG